MPRLVPYSNVNSFSRWIEHEILLLLHLSFLLNHFIWFGFRYSQLFFSWMSDGPFEIQIVDEGITDVFHIFLSLSGPVSVSVGVDQIRWEWLFSSSAHFPRLPQLPHLPHCLWFDSDRFDSQRFDSHRLRSTASTSVWPFNSMIFIVILLGWLGIVSLMPSALLIIGWLGDWADVLTDDNWLDNPRLFDGYHKL